MKIYSLGHACFLYETDSGTKIITDPYDPSIGYPVQRIETDAALISHGHYDHSYTGGLLGNPMLISKEGTEKVSDVNIISLPCFHDTNNGKDRGNNLIHIVEADGIRVAHLGDLGHIPSEELFMQLKGLDAMLIPVGGTFTVDAKTAKQIVDTAKPRVIIPMHFQTERLTLGKKLDSVESFVSLFDGFTAVTDPYLDIQADDGKKGVFVLPYAGAEE